MAFPDWLAGGAIKFASLGAVYDTIHFPGNFTLQFARPQAALQLELEEKFPGSSKDIQAFFAAIADADRAGRAVWLVGKPLRANAHSHCGASSGAIVVALLGSSA